ncbi:MAG: adenylate/guanylate cyclase domain-containing protein [Desulfobacterales bacterium]|jgi:class 3 adenylate cyclase/tetratricopeptide (TPR) repeat protein
MQCPKCQFENPEGIKFCVECGNKLETKCPKCGFSNSPNFKFCGECGYNLQSPKDVFVEISEPEIPTHHRRTEKPSNDLSPIDGERKHVTVLFADLTGYTAMSEKLDPEEVKEITSRIFGEITKIVANYDGFIEKYAGDAVMAIFGVPQAHEDDPIRAIKAAREIHQLMDVISPDVEKKIGQSISMHTGINTGLVVTGEVDMERGTHGVAGDTINLASRLSHMASPGEILIDVDTCRQVEGQFACEYIDTTSVKGKADPVQVHKVLSQRDKPVTIRRLSGMRSDLVGRNVELAELSEAVDNLRQSKGRVFSICGAAGTGKSRLVEEFKAGIDLKQIQWIEGHAYAYSQNIPYFPLIDLLNRVLHIEENDPPEKVREKVESGIESLVGKQEDIVPYVGGLYSLSYPEAENVSPEFWKSRLQTAILAILSSLANRAPTIFFLEDLHWADPSFVELLRRACFEIQQPAIVLCAYRPTFSLFTGHQVSNIGKYYHDIQLQNLSLSVAQNMLASLLKTETIPLELKRWVQSKAEGNPFYLEELVNSLIESETLVRDNGSWSLTRSLAESDIPSSLHGLITGRLDRLDKQTKRILQKASVIGRDFLYEILKKITELEERIDGELSQLERLDLIRTRSLHPDIEYMFKHALTQEIVYSGLLKKQRQEIHEQIARVIESVFKGRIEEFNETLAYHYARGQSDTKAIDYLMKSGEKSLARYAVEEAHQYFRKAYDILASREELSEAEKNIFIDILNSWGYVYYFLGEIREFINIFKSHQDMAESLQNKAKTGMFYVWFGTAHYMAGLTKEGYEYLCKALKLGQSAGDQKVVGYACTWLTWACAELGFFDEGIGYGESAQKIAESYASDQYLYFKSLGGLCLIYFFIGDTRKIFESTKRLLEYGERNANSRSKVIGHWMEAFGHQAAGDMKSAQKSCEKAMEVALDPFYANFPNFTLGVASFLNGQLQKAEDALQSSIKFGEKYGEGEMSVICQCFMAPILIAKGEMQQGTKLMEDAQKTLIRNQRRYSYALSEYILGEVNSQIATSPKFPFSIVAKNIGFLVKTVPFATKSAEQHFKKAIKIFNELGAKGQLGIVYLSLGLLHKATKKTDKAQHYLLEAINFFQECEAGDWLKQANEALDSLG